MKIPMAEHFTQLEIKKSKFLTFALPVDSLEEVRQWIKQKKEEHPDAAHVVHAAIVGSSGSQYSMSDDGEPKGTSGRPALEVLKGSGLTNIAVLIVRYFGGTKLGTGGLVKAYGNAVKAVLGDLKTEELVEKYRFRISLNYQDHRAVHQLFSRESIEILEEQFGEEVVLEACCTKDLLEKIKAAVQDISNGRSELVIG